MKKWKIIFNIKLIQANFLSFITSSIVLPIYAGELVTLIPAFYIALIFSGALPFPLETIAPACPILLSAGAVNPAINPTIGLLNGLLCLIQSQALIYKNNTASSASPPISPIITMPSVSGSNINLYKKF